MSKRRRDRYLTEGERWGRVTVTRCEWIDRPPVEVDGDMVFPRDLRYTFLCECGRIFARWDHEFPGKLKVKDCGCGLAVKDRGAVPSSYSIPQGLLTKLRAYAAAHRMKISRAVLRLAEGSRKGQKWNWRIYDGKTELPEECWKWGIRVKEYKNPLMVTLPTGLREALERAGAVYGSSASRILTGLLSRALDGEDRRAGEFVAGKPVDRPLGDTLK